MAVARFFSNGSSIIQTIKSVADQRIADGTFVTDIADAYGLIIRENVLVNLARKEDLTAEDMVELTQDERKALSQFLWVKMMQWPQRDEVVTNMIVQTIWAGNQMIVLEVLD